PRQRALIQRQHQRPRSVIATGQFGSTHGISSKIHDKCHFDAKTRTRLATSWIMVATSNACGGKDDASPAPVVCCSGLSHVLDDGSLVVGANRPCAITAWLRGADRH